MARAWLVAVASAVTLAACAGTPEPAGPVPDVGGVWIGTINPQGEMLGAQSLPSGAARLQLTQRGRDVAGTLSGPGFSGQVTGLLYGNRLHRTFEGTSVGEGGIGVNATLDGAFRGTEFRGRLDGNGLLTLTRQ